MEGKSGGQSLRPSLKLLAAESSGCEDIPLSSFCQREKLGTGDGPSVSQVARSSPEAGSPLLQLGRKLWKPWANGLNDSFGPGTTSFTSRTCHYLSILVI